MVKVWNTLKMLEPNIVNMYDDTNYKYIYIVLLHSPIFGNILQIYHECKSYTGISWKLNKHVSFEVL